MKRLCSIILVVTLLFSMALVPGYALGNKKFVPPGLAKKGGLPPGIAKKFVDIGEYEWARDAIEKMAEKGIIKGIDDDEYAPSSSVTKVEALAMIMRVLEWEDDAEEYKDLIAIGKRERRTHGKVQDWGIGYVELAEEMGLLDEVDILQQNFNTPATRQEIAKYIIRALDVKDDSNNYVQEAQNNMDRELEFKDASAIQMGSVGYVYLIGELGIMVGNTDNTFQPNKPVTRAEMAILVDKIDGEIEDRFRQITGLITDIDDDEIEIEINGLEKEYDLARRLTVVDYDGDSIRFSRVEEDMKVKLTLEGDEVVKIQLISDKRDDYEIEGEITNIYYEEEKLTIKYYRDYRTFYLTKDTDIEIDDEDADFDELMVGMEVELEIEDGELVDINASLFEREYEGKLIKIEGGAQNKITLKIDGTEKSFVVDQDAEIEIDDEDESFVDLLDEYYNEIEIDTINNIVVKIVAD